MAVENHKTCGVSKTLKIIGNKWSMYILHSLFSGTKRFGQLQGELNGISPKTLSLRLKELEKEGILKKKIYTEIPLHVEYTLTTKGESLKEIFEKISEWGEQSA
ncbi:helix-turn-helix transcriptional regulator [Candidatus Daviesbacteria bacterium]|nr:helix-turn-helix transcriptional regulator [Candidatus Daviesbacteria bacterium]